MDGGQELNIRIAKNIRSIRGLKGFKQGFVASRLGITPNGYGKMERGEILISVERLEVIARIFGVSIMEIIQWDMLGRTPRVTACKEDAPSSFAEEHIWQEMADIRNEVILLQKLVLKHSKQLEKLLKKK